MSSAAGNNRQMCCLICGQMQPKNSFLTHISEHLNYRQHKCQECEFESVTAEEMADHEAATEHLGHAVRNAYMDRVCRFIYNDCDFGEKNGGLAKVLKRKLVSANEEEAAGHSNPQLANNNPNPPAITSKTATTIANALPTANCGFGGNGTSLAQNPSMVLKAEECALPSPKVVLPSSTDQQMPMPPSSTIGQHSQSNSGSATPFSHSQEWIGTNPLVGHLNSAASELSTAANLFGGMKMDLEGGNGQFFHPQQIVMPDGEIRSEFPAEDADFLEQAFGGGNGGQCSSSALKHDQQSALEKFIAEQQQHIAGGSGQQQMLFDEEVDGEEEDEGDEQPANADDATNSQFDQITLRRTNAPRHKNVGNTNANAKNKKELKQSFQNVKCLKCGQWVKGRGICLLYHINTRHLKLPMFRCLACPRDFYYVTDTTAKNHIRSFHGNDQSLLENNYPTMSKTLHESRREFFGINVMRPGRSSKLAAKRAKASAKKAAAIASKVAKEITIRDRPQAGSNVAGNSSHLQCAQCGEFVATIYASQLGHMNTKHLHLGVFQCKLCDRQFESLSNSSAIMHVKSAHSKNKTEAISFITDRREQCLKQLNESYRTYFN